MSENRLWWARLSSTSPRYAAWKSILGTDDVPLVSPGSGDTELIGEGRAEVYLLDLSQLSAEQMERLVDAVSREFSADKSLVREGILREGFPVRAADVYVAFSPRAFI